MFLPLAHRAVLHFAHTHPHPRSVMLCMADIIRLFKSAHFSLVIRGALMSRCRPASRCMLGISLLLLEELQQIKQFVLLYPPQGEKGPPRTAYVLAQQTLAQQALVKTLALAAVAS